MFTAYYISWNAEVKQEVYQSLKEDVQVLKDASSFVYNKAQEETGKFVKAVKDTATDANVDLDPLKLKEASYDTYKSSQQAAANFVDGVKDFASTTAEQGLKMTEEVKNLASKYVESAVSSETFQNTKMAGEAFVQNTIDQATKHYKMISGFAKSLMDKVTQKGKTL